MNFKKIIVTSAALLTFSALSTSAFARLHNEAYYVNNFCHKLDGAIEFRFDDNTRCDCLTSTHAIEIDFANNFYQAIGQSLYYSTKANKTPGIALILEHKKDHKYLIRLNTIINYYNLPIKTWIIKEWTK